MIIEYHRLYSDVQHPTRSNPSDAGLDIYAFLGAKDDFKTVLPNHSVLIPTGLRFGIPHGYMLQVMNRSSVAAKRGLVVGAHVIDSGYEGEVFINLHNIGYQRQDIKHGDKIAQLVMIPVVHFRAFEEVDGMLYDERHPITISERGSGALGSTGG
jgi:dUTP pyrophosphatase